jgi:hypothetical protein
MPQQQISDAKLAANRANAQLSTGPTSSEGKAKSSLNAVKTGLTGRVVVLSTEDAEAYRQHLDRLFTRLAPANEEEHTLVQFIADTEWRLLRINPLEASLYANGRRELAHLVADEPDPASREALLLGKIQSTYRKDFGNLALQERRLRNHHKADSEKLQALQQARRERQENEHRLRQQEMCRAMAIVRKAKSEGIDFDPVEFGFEYSIPEIEHFIQKIPLHVKLTGQIPEVEKALADFRNEQKESQAA